MAKQKLTPEATAAKAKRDTLYAKTPFRRKRKAENQRLGQKSNSDIHHKSDGTTERVSIKKNRGNFGKGTKKENMSTAFKLKYTNGKKADPSAFPFKVDGGVGSSSPTKFLKFNKEDAKANMENNPWGAILGVGGLAASALIGSGKQKTEEDVDKIVNEYNKEAQQKDIRKANARKLSENQEQDVSNAEDMSEPKAPKSKTQELDKAIKEVKKQKSRPMTENQAETL